MRKLEHSKVVEFTAIDRIVLTLTYILIAVTVMGCIFGIVRFFQRMHHYNQVRVLELIEAQNRQKDLEKAIEQKEREEYENRLQARKSKKALPTNNSITEMPSPRSSNLDRDEDPPQSQRRLLNNFHGDIEARNAKNDRNKKPKIK